MASIDCIFCGAKADSNEHAIPAWVARRLHLKGHELEYLAERSQIPSGRKQKISVAGHRARILCKPCNTHFGQLEEEAIPILVWMAMNRAVKLGTDEQRILARWGAKTGFALLATEDELRANFPYDHAQIPAKARRTPPRRTGLVTRPGTTGCTRARTNRVSTFRVGRSVAAPTTSF